MFKKEDLDQILTEVEINKLSQFAMDEEMKEAVKKILLYSIYYSGVIKKGIKITPFENCALLFANNPSITDEEIARHTRAVYQGINAMELGFNDIDRYKLEKMPEVKPNQAR